MNENFRILIRLLLDFVFKGPIENESPLYQVMAWRRTIDVSLSEPMVTRFFAASMRHTGGGGD